MRLMLILIALLWDRSGPKTLRPLHHSATNQTTVIHAHPTRPGPARPGPARPTEGTEQEKENTHQECTNTLTWRLPRPLRCYSSQDVWSPVLVTQPDPNHRISVISLRPPPSITTSSSAPLPPSLRECLVCANSMLQDLAGGPMLRVK